MTMTPHLVSVNTTAVVAAEPQSFTAFALERMFPKMIGYWVSSAGQFERNAPALAEAYEEKLEGFTPRQIMDALKVMSDDTGREFAPKPGELKAFLVSSIKPSQAKREFIASMASIEMQVCTDVVIGKVAKTRADIESAINQKIEFIIAQGGVVDGVLSFEPLKSIIQSLG